MEFHVRCLGLTLGFAASLAIAAGCHKQANDNDAIRAGIRQHLTGLGTLNMSAMDMDVRSLSINGNQAHAEVEFRPKGNPSGAGMQVAYNLEKHDGTWTVLKTQPLGGMIQHPDPNQNPHTNQNVHFGELPNFREMVNSAGTPAQGALPPGHPAVSSPQTSSPANAQTPSPSNKPR